MALETATGVNFVAHLGRRTPRRLLTLYHCIGTSSLSPTAILLRNPPNCEDVFLPRDCRASVQKAESLESSTRCDGGEMSCLRRHEG